mmetsp:Transcript_34797/g.81279  ORF Transcript_34797/g.81279 Transcript_34797/m.81279 type:complete len:214 (-) Transcript_34797:42-683(-)
MQLIREAKLVSTLGTHPNIVQVYDLLEEDPYFGIIMEFLSGEPLKAKLQSATRLRAGEVRRVSVACLEALVHAHNHNVVHRDIKPDNIFICSDQTVKLLDFGLARLVEERSLHTSVHMAGTPAYMAPEAFDRFYGFSSDLWSMSAVMFHCLTGELPFSASRPVAPPVVLQPEDVPEHADLVQVVARGLNLQRADRYQSAAEMLQALKGSSSQD